jgi:hypothetical protein
VSSWKEGLQARNKYINKGYQVRSWKEGKSMTASITTKYFLQTEHVASTIKNYVPDIFPIPKATPSQLGTLSCMSTNMNYGPHPNPSTDGVSLKNLRHMKTALSKTIQKKGVGG